MLQVNDSAKFYLETALQHSRENNWPDQEEKSLNNLGMSNLNSGKFSVALEYFSAGYGLINFAGAENTWQYRAGVPELAIQYRHRHHNKRELREKYSNAMTRPFPTPTWVYIKSLNITDSNEHYSKPLNWQGTNSMRMYMPCTITWQPLIRQERLHSALPLLLTALSALESLAKIQK